MAAAAQGLDSPARLLDVAHQVETFLRFRLLLPKERRQVDRCDDQAQPGDLLRRLCQLGRRPGLVGEEEHEPARLAGRHHQLQLTKTEPVDGWLSCDYMCRAEHGQQAGHRRGGMSWHGGSPSRSPVLRRSGGSMKHSGSRA